MVCEEAISVVMEYYLKRHYKSRHKLLFKFLRKLRLNWYLSVVTFGVRNKFCHAKVACNTKKVGQACDRVIFILKFCSNYFVVVTASLESNA